MEKFKFLEGLENLINESTWNLIHSMKISTSWTLAPNGDLVLGFVPLARINKECALKRLSKLATDVNGSPELEKNIEEIIQICRRDIQDAFEANSDKKLRELFSKIQYQYLEPIKAFDLLYDGKTAEMEYNIRDYFLGYSLSDEYKKKIVLELVFYPNNLLRIIPIQSYGQYKYLLVMNKQDTGEYIIRAETRLFFKNLFELNEKNFFDRQWLMKKGDSVARLFELISIFFRSHQKLLCMPNKNVLCSDVEIEEYWSRINTKLIKKLSKKQKIFVNTYDRKRVAIFFKIVIEGYCQSHYYFLVLVNGKERYLNEEYQKLVSLVDWFNYLIQKDYNFRMASLRSGISAIMSRNMSHNIGSHILADLVAKGIKGSTDAELNNFYRYLQNRMDFIAQITTEFPQWTYPAHYNSEVMRIFYENFLLLDRIAVSEGLEAYNWPEKNEWWKGDMRGKVIVRTCGATWKKGSISSKCKWIINEFKMGELNNDLQLAIPGGIVGYHAFYTIIENVIRNSAKHGYASRRSNNLGSVDDSKKEEASIVLVRKDDGQCRYWSITENSTEKEFQAKSIDGLGEILPICAAIIIDASCLGAKKEVVTEKNGFIDSTKSECANAGYINLNGRDFLVPDLKRLYIGCSLNYEKCRFNRNTETKDGKLIGKSPCNCFFADNKIWGEEKLQYHLLTKYEWKKLLEKELTLGNEEKEKEKHCYKRVINFLQKGALRINIRVDDLKDKDYVWVTIWDDMPHQATVNFQKDDDVRKEVSGCRNDFKDENIRNNRIWKPFADKNDAKENEDKNKEKKNNDNKETEINLFGYMNDMLRESFVKETGELKKENWGIAELKICAGYLQNRLIEEIGGEGQDIIQYGLHCFDIENTEPKDGDAKDKYNGSKYIINDEKNPNYGYPKMLIKALPVDKTGQLFKRREGKKEITELTENDVYYLGFRFWMKKPKTVALTGIDCKKGES